MLCFDNCWAWTALIQTYNDILGKCNIIILHQSIKGHMPPIFGKFKL